MRHRFGTMHDAEAAVRIERDGADRLAEAARHVVERFTQRALRRRLARDARGDILCGDVAQHEFTPARRRDGRKRVRIVAGARHRRTRARTEIVVRPDTQRVIDDALADFLTARWALFTTQRGKTIHLRNTHEPWPLFTATLEVLDDHLLADTGFADLAPRPPDSVLFSPGVTTWFSGTRTVCD